MLTNHTPGRKEGSRKLNGLGRQRGGTQRGEHRKMSRKMRGKEGREARETQEELGRTYTKEKQGGKHANRKIRNVCVRGDETHQHDRMKTEI